MAELVLKEITPAERERYDQVIQKFPQCDYTQSYAWGELKRISGWQPIRVLLMKGAEVKGTASILKKKLPFCNRCFFYITRGPLLEDYADLALVENSFKLLRDLAEREKAIFIKFDPDIPGPDPVLKGYLKSIGFRPARKRGNFNGLQPQHVCRINLDRPLEEIFRSFHSKTRYNIKLAEKKGVQVVEGGYRDLPVFYKILQETCARDDFGVRALSYFEDLYGHFAAKGRGKLLLASYGGKIISGVLLTYFGSKAWYLYGASSNRFRAVMPNYLLQWRAIQWAREQGCAIYDFLGVASSFDPASPLYGMYRFKRGFSPEVVEFIGEYDLPLSPLFYFLWNQMEPAYLKTQVNLGKLRRHLRHILVRHPEIEPVT